MSEAIYGVALLCVVAWPLLLVIPAIHSRLPRPRLLAILPAMVLTVLPGDASVELPWVLFGSGFAVDHEVRWVLAMFVAIWLTAAHLAKSSRHDSASDRVTTLFLLTLAGNLGAILAADLVGFFSFLTLMGYGFYGLLIQDTDKEVRHAGCLYLIFLIVADLALLEALLIAAWTTEDLRYETVRQAMAGTASAPFYLWMVLAAVTLRAGIWPVHLWVSAVFGAAPLSRALVLIGGPIAMGLLGAIRWLPLGEMDFQGPWEVIQVMGIAAVLYAVAMLIMRATLKTLPAWATIAATGLFIAVLGTGLADPAVWRRYEHLAVPFIASLGIFMAALVFAIGRRKDTREPPSVALRRMETLSLWVGRRMGVGQQWVEDKSLGLQFLWRASWLKVVTQHQRLLNWQQSGVMADRWSAAITLFVLLGLVLAWLAG
jgi:multicomponent K+:H+ antiporter subunit D